MKHVKWNNDQLISHGVLVSKNKGKIVGRVDIHPRLWEDFQMRAKSKNFALFPTGEKFAKFTSFTKFSY